MKLKYWIVILNFGFVMQAQNTFEKTYGGEFFEEAKSVLQTLDGGYIIGGTNLVKVDNAGVEEWTKPYPSVFANTTSDDGYILINSSSPNVTFTKTDINGETLWQTNYSQGIWANRGRYIEQVEDGGYIVAGDYQDVAGSGMLLLKLNSEGNKLWQTSFNEPSSAGFCRGYSAEQTNDGGYIITGFTYIDYYESTRHKDVIIVKTDSTGIEQWRRYFGGTMDDSGSFVKQDNQGDYYISGTTNSTGSETDQNMYLIKLDSNGDSLWTRTYGGELEETATGMWLTNDGGCIIVGKSNSLNNDDFNGYSVKTDGDGNILWTRSYGGTGVENINSVQQTSDNGYIMAGYTNSIGAGDFDMWLLKTDSLGNSNLNTEINENTKSKIFAYPNPSTGIISINSELRMSKIEITNLIGETIYSKEISKNKIKLDLGREAKGVYFYQIYIGENNTFQSGKIVLQ